MKVTFRNKASWLAVAVFGIFAAFAYSFPGLAASKTPCGDKLSCDLPMGKYYAYLPKSYVGPARIGAILFLHGHRGKGEVEIRNASFRRMADELGVAFIAVSGLEGTWSFPNAPRALRDEPAFFDQVIEDLTQRFPVRRDRLMLSGFSSGAFMTWYLACGQSRRFAGYAPIAGAFWQPLPERCPGETPYLFHMHGTSDPVVPLEGRALGGGRYRQGDVLRSFDVWLRQIGLGLEDGRAVEDGDLRCREWGTGEGGLELCLHPGGHGLRAEWISRAWRKLSLARGWKNEGAEENRSAACAAAPTSLSAPKVRGESTC